MLQNDAIDMPQIVLAPYYRGTGSTCWTDAKSNVDTEHKINLGT